MYYSPFPAVADAVQSELEQYKQSEEEVKRLKDAMVSVQFYAVCIHTCIPCMRNFNGIKILCY